VADHAHERVHIDASPAACFALAADFENYPAWAADVKHARVVDRDVQGRPTRVDYRAAALGRSIRYVLDYDLTDAPRSFSWKLVEGDLLRTLEGTYRFDVVDRGTDVTYDLTVDLAIPLPGLVKRRAAGRIVGAALQDLKHAVEARALEPEPPPAAAPEAAPAAAPDPEDVVDPEPVEVPDEPVGLRGSSVPDPDLVPDGYGAPDPDLVPDGYGAPDRGSASDDAPQGTHFDDVGTEARSLPSPSPIELVISELLGAVPEVRDHLLAAADELLDAAKALLDAADRVVRQQREGNA
jgi:hypothetical protein